MRLAIWLAFGIAAGIIYLKKRAELEGKIYLSDMFTFFGMTMFGFISFLTIIIGVRKFFGRRVWKKKY